MLGLVEKYPELGQSTPASVPEDRQMEWLLWKDCRGWRVIRMDMGVGGGGVGL